MKRTIIPALLVALLTGCAAQKVNTAQSQFYRAADGGTITFDGALLTKVEDGLFSRTVTRVLTIRANGETVIEAGIHPLNLSGEFTGTYKGKAITAICSKGTRSVDCLMLVNNERAVTLSIF